jgi:hypothetical protein
MTIAIESTDGRQVRTALDTVIAAWSEYLKEIAVRNPSNKLARVTVLRADDGIWYLQAGILGPAVKVTEKYIVISWSPEALRQALKAMNLENSTPVVRGGIAPAPKASPGSAPGSNGE